MEEFAKEREAFDDLDSRQIYRLVNKMLTIQRKDYYRKSEYTEYEKDANEILRQFHDKSTKDFKSLIRYIFINEASVYGKKIVGDQTPRHIFYVKELAEMYPSAKFIEMIRDPRAILLSQKRKWRGGKRYGQPKFEIARTFLNYHPITMTLLWKKVIAAGSKSCIHMGPQNYCRIIFEKLVMNPEQEMKSLFNFLAIQFERKTLNVNVELSADKNDEGKNGVQSVVSERWQKGLNNTEIFIAESLAGSEMKGIGYDLTGKKPNYLYLIFYYCLLPFQLFINILFNIGRMGNPFDYIVKRITQ
jgi:hypothetical protein